MKIAIPVKHITRPSLYIQEVVGPSGVVPGKTIWSAVVFEVEKFEQLFDLVGSYDELYLEYGTEVWKFDKANVMVKPTKPGVSSDREPVMVATFSACKKIA